MRIVKIKAFQFSELSDKAKAVASYEGQRFIESYTYERPDTSVTIDELGFSEDGHFLNDLIADAHPNGWIPVSFETKTN